MSGSDALIGMYWNGLKYPLTGEKGGAWPSGPYSWGPARIWIEGSKYNRKDFSIHGGLSPESAGCIDIMQDIVPFIIELQKYSKGSSHIRLIVNYDDL